MRRKISEQDKLYRKKLKDNKKLADKALKQGVKLKCSPGRKFLKDVPVGRLVKCGNSEAVVYKKTDSSVMVIAVKYKDSFSNDAFYYGDRRWAPESEVEVLD